MYTSLRPRRGRALTGVLAFLVTLTLTFLPSNAFATLTDDIEEAFQETVQGMVGTEFDVDSVTFDFFGVEMSVTVLGLAFCEPADPYAAPVSPVPPLNVYGCENLATVGADVAGDEESATILIEISDIFLDLESSRDETILCALDGDTFPYDGTVNADGYMLGHATIAAGVELTFQDWCYRASLIPGSVDFTLVPDVMASQDECLAENMDDVLMPILYPLVEDQMNIVYEALLVLMMEDISDFLCAATPVENTTWSGLKGLYR